VRGAPLIAGASSGISFGQPRFCPFLMLSIQYHRRRTLFSRVSFITRTNL
jgi:hypothetical protein